MSKMSTPVVAWLVAVKRQVQGNRVAVGLVVDQNAAEVVAGLRVERSKQFTELGVLFAEVGHGCRPANQSVVSTRV